MNVAACTMQALVVLLALATLASGASISVSPQLIEMLDTDTGPSWGFTDAIAMGSPTPSPSATVTLTVTRSPTGTNYLAPTPTTLTLTSTTTSINVKLNPKADSPLAGTVTYTIAQDASTSADSAYKTVKVPSVIVKVRDTNGFNDPSPLAVSLPMGWTASDADLSLYTGSSKTVTFTRKSATAPKNPVTITPIFPGSGYSYSPNPFVFATTDTSKVMTLARAYDDTIGTGGRTVSVSFNVTSADPVYNDQYIKPIDITTLAPAFHLLTDVPDTSVEGGTTATFRFQIDTSIGAKTTQVSNIWEQDTSSESPSTRAVHSSSAITAFAPFGSNNVNPLLLATTPGQPTGRLYRSRIFYNDPANRQQVRTRAATLYIISTAVGATGGSSSATGSSGSSGASGFGDPHFVGWNGVMFDFDGQNGRVYNLLTDADLQVNMRLGQLRASARDVLPGVYMTEMGLRIHNVNVKIATAGDSPDDTASVVTVDGKQMPLMITSHTEPLDIPTQVFDGACSITVEFPATNAKAFGIDDEYEWVTNAVTFNLGERYSFTILLLRRVGFYLLPRRTLAIYGSLGDKKVSQPHGILGQTARKNQELARAVTGSWGIEGTETDYQVASDDLFGSDFTFNRFNSK
jgi:hypothetical protein